MSTFQDRRTVMVDTQVRPSDVTKFPIIDAMLKIPREIFVGTDQRGVAYMDGHLTLGEGRVLLEPRAFAKMLDALDIQPTEIVLDLGCGYGYSSAVLAYLAEAVVAVEEDETMADEAQARLSAEGIDNAAVMSAPLTEGEAHNGPYDVIVLQGGVQQVPDALINQLREGGRIACIFQTGALGVCRVGYKQDGAVSWRDAFNASAPILSGFEIEEAFAL